MKQKATVMNGDDVERVLRRMAVQIVERNRGLENLTILGIQRRGVNLAMRMRDILKTIENVKVPLGVLDITLYRDDITTMIQQPIVHTTSIPGEITGRRIILVDDVLYTGRTIRAALDAIMDFGRPSCVQLAVLIDRGHRELPIQPDYLGRDIPTSRAERVEVRVASIDGEDGVFICD